MSVVDERVVEMQFNNSRFEQNVSTSISTLDKLKSALNLNGATKGMQAVENYSSRFDLSGIGSAVELVSSRFTLLGMVGVTALQNIVNKAVDAGERLVKSMSVDQIMSGWGKYADKTTSVQTIMAATEGTWEKSAEAIGFAGSQMDFVNSQMEKLNWFTDETSYNFTDMVSNIGKFTANNIPLEESVTAMQGIANWAAVSGQNAASASRAMYNLSQAIGVGSVKLMDWRSIENANMATAEFKEKVLEVAEANGQLKKQADGTYKTLSGTEVNVQNFSQSLSEGWFDKDTLLGVLDQYGSFTNELYKFSEASGLTATEILGLVDAQTEGSLSQEQLAKSAEECGMSIDDFQSALLSLGSEENEFGRKTFKAAQEAKTFQDAIDATKDAASTKWMNIFENIFGNYEEAKSLWTGFAEFLYDTLVSPLERIEEATKKLKSWGTFDRFLEGFKNLWSFLNGDGENVVGILGHIREAFNDVFPNRESLEIKVHKLAVRFRNFTKDLSLTDDQVEDLKNTFKGIFSVFKLVSSVLKSVWEATAPLRSALGNLASAFLHATGSLGKWLSGLSETDGKTTILQKISQGLADAINWVSNAIKNFSFSTTFGPAIDWIKEKFEALKTFIQGIDFKNLFKGGLGLGVAGLVGGGAYKLLDRLTSPLESIKELIGSSQGLVEKVKTLLGGLGGALKDFQLNVKTDAIKNIAVAILAVAAAFLILGFVNYENAVIGIGIISTLLAVFIANLEQINKVDPKKLATLAGTLIAVAAAFFIISVSLAILAGVIALFALVAKMDTVWKGFGLMAAALAVLTLALLAFSKMSPKVLAGAASLFVVAFALAVLAGALALFALVAKMDTIGTGLAILTYSLLILVAALAVLNEVALGALAGAAALLIVSFSLLVLAGALAAFSAVAGMETFGTGLAAMTLSLLLLVGALVALAAVGPMVIVGAAALLVGAAACIALAIAIGVVSLVLPLLGFGLQKLAEGISNGVTALSAAVQSFGEGLGSAVEAIGVGIGGAIDGIGEGIAGAIEAIFASVGKGIGEGISAIAEGVDTFSASISGVGDSIMTFGIGVRSLDGISWTATALGIAELASALKKIKKNDSSTTLLTELFNEINDAIPRMTELGADMSEAFSTGMRNKVGIARSAGSSLGSSARSGISSVSLYVTAQNFIQGFLNGLSDKMPSVYEKGKEIARSAKQGIEDEADEHSPSREAERLGSYFGGGFVIGISKRIGDAYDISSKMAESTISALSSAQSLINKVLEDDFTPVIAPVIDLSNVQNGLNTIQSLSVTAGLQGARDISAAGINRPSDLYNDGRSSDIQTLIALNRELLAVAKAGGQVYLDGDVIAGTVNSRLGVL